MCDLGGLVKSVLLRMMLHPYGPQDLRRLTKQLKQVGCCQLSSYGWSQTGAQPASQPTRQLGVGIALAAAPHVASSHVTGFVRVGHAWHAC